MRSPPSSLAHRYLALGMLLLLPSVAAQAQPAPESAAPITAPPAQPSPQAPARTTLPEVVVIGTTPLPGVGIDRDKLPANAISIPGPDTAKQGPAGLGTALDERLGSVNVNANQDNPFQPDIQYRGFEASPILGTPIGVAVYQNGIRLNEPFGDNVNWDLVPDFAINRLSVIPTNPVYGLNALGGAMVIDMKNGFNFQGGEAEASGGSFGRRQFTLQYGKQVGNIAAYIGGNAYNDEGFRKFSPSQVRQLYADIGAEGPAGSLHLSFTGANNNIIGVGPTPIQLVDIDRRAVFTSPQKFHNTLLMPSLNGNYIASDTLSFQSDFYLRSAGRHVFNGNTTDAQLCADPTLLCFGDTTTPLIGTSGAQVPSSVLGGGIPGQNDNSSITSLGLGGSLQGTYTAPLLGHGNRLVVGAGLDHADVDFNSTDELGTIDPNTLLVSGLGIIIDQPDGSLGPIRLETTTSYYGVYASDTLDVTPKLAVTAGARYNVALIHLIDKLGTALNGESRFSRLNPAVGATYKILPNLTGYFGYAESNRAPTAGEIACSDPARPCSLDNFLTSDPPGLKQVVARTYEAGLRGRLRAGTSETARIDWNIGLFRTDLDNDILNVPSAIISSGFFQNVGGTRRQGIEAGIGYRDDKWNVSANYSLIDATFQSAITLSSPNNPSADAAGDIQVRPGDHLPGIPQHRLKLSADYAITDKWTFGGNVIVASDQYFFGDQSNQNPKLGGYYVVNLHSSYAITDNVELFVLVDNLFDRKYATFAIFGDVTKTPLPGVANPSDPRFESVSPPLSAFGGLRIRF
jgi:iron complex outermembrane recepter protein